MSFFIFCTFFYIPFLVSSEVFLCFINICLSFFCSCLSDSFPICGILLSVFLFTLSFLWCSCCWLTFSFLFFNILIKLFFSLFIVGYVLLNLFWKLLSFLNALLSSISILISFRYQQIILSFLKISFCFCLLYFFLVFFFFKVSFLIFFRFYSVIIFIFNCLSSFFCFSCLFYSSLSFFISLSLDTLSFSFC